MARYDKYEPKGGGFRAPLAADMAEADIDTIKGVGLDVNGHLVIGAGETGIIGVFSAPRQLKAGEIADTMTDGDVVDVDDMSPGATAFANPSDGVITESADGTDGAGTGIRVGYVVGDRNGPRLVVRVGRNA